MILSALLFLIGITVTVAGMKNIQSGYAVIAGFYTVIIISRYY